MALLILNKKVAVAPPNLAVEKEVRHGVAIAKQKFSLLETTVVFADSEGFVPVGTKVFLRGDCIINGWAKEVFELEGKKFILVPIDQIVCAEKA